jgi:transposase
MSFIIREKRNGKVYLYEATSYWDKEKKQSRQKRKYIGRDPEDKKSEIKINSAEISTKNYGNIFLLNHISKRLGLQEILKEMFPFDYNEILGLAYFDICASQPSYMFPYWHAEQHITNTKKLNSSSVSRLQKEIGVNDGIRIEFINKWIETVKPCKAIYYDVTSISAYARGIETVEWGYNRDKEALPQINMGVVFSKSKSLPIYYNPYQGSITDVSTLRNCLQFLTNMTMKDVMFVLDRGFFSKNNISQMNDPKNRLEFIQPVPLSVKKAKELLYKHRKQLKDIRNSLLYNEDLLYYYATEFEYYGTNLYAHIYHNPQLANTQKEAFIIKLLKIEIFLKQQKFKSQKEFNSYKNSDMTKSYRPFFKWNRKLGSVEKNASKINNYTSKFGSFILASNRENLNKEGVLEAYRKKDLVEKMFDIVKNEMDGDRLRTHSDQTTRGKLFIRFIALIIYAEISLTMKREKLFKKMSVKELIAELTKLKKTKFKGKKTIYSVLSKRQKIILKAFNIDIEQFS